MSGQGAGALAGLLFAAGVLVVVARLIATRRPSLLARVAPYVPPTPATIALRQPEPGVVAVLIELLRPAWQRATTAIGRSPGQPAGGRLDQLAWTAGGAGAGAVLGLLAMARGSGAAAPAVLAGFGGLLGVLSFDRWQSARRRQRSTRLSEQLPAAGELLAFAVAAGEPPVAALERTSRLLGGELADELAATVADVRSGTAMTDALRDLAVRSGSPEVERFADGLIVSIERGTPLVDVLRAQAADARAGSRRRLMELAGRKDVLMLVPVVFLILPCVVLIAVYPGFTSLRLIVP